MTTELSLGVDQCNSLLLKIASHFFFQPPCGARNLWDLVLVLCDGDESLLPASYRKGVIHTKHLVRHKAVSILLFPT